MKAIVLAGGKATRLYPMTLIMPKQLVMLRGRPVIQYIIEHLLANEVTEIILCISDNWLKEHFSNALNDRRYRSRLRFSVGPESLGTSGRILYAKRFLTDDDFLVYYGDILTSLSLRSLIKSHFAALRLNRCICTLALTKSARIDFGVALADRNEMRVLCFKERPVISEISEFSVNIGIGVFNRSILQYCSPRSDLYGHAVPLAIKEGNFVNTYLVSEPFYDIGTFASIERALTEFRLTHSRGRP